MPRRLLKFSNFFNFFCFFTSPPFSSFGSYMLKKVIYKKNASAYDFVQLDKIPLTLKFEYSNSNSKKSRAF